MNSNTLARFCLLSLVILPAASVAQEQGASFNAPPNGVLKQSATPHDAKPADLKPANTKPAKSTSANTNLANIKPANAKPANKYNQSVSVSASNQRQASTTPAKQPITPKVVKKHVVSKISHSGTAAGSSAAVRKVMPPVRRSAPSTHADTSLARINTDRVNIRKGPGEEYVRLTLLDKETRVKAIGSQGEWLQATLPSGQNGWLRRRFADLPSTTAPAPNSNPQDRSQPAIAVTAASPAKAPAAQSTTASKPGITTASAQSASPGAQKLSTASPVTSLPASDVTATPNVAAQVSKSGTQTEFKKAASTTPVPADSLAGTKPDPAEKTQESPAATMRDAWKLMLYLVPMLALIVLSIRGLKAFQQKAGWLPGVKHGLIGSLNLINSKKSGGSSIRVLESVPLGTVGLHLVEVKGRVLLLGTSGASISVLTEVKEAENLDRAEFKAILNAAAEDLNGQASNDVPLSSLVGNIDDSLRETRELIAQKTAAVRHWSEI